MFTASAAGQNLRPRCCYQHRVFKMGGKTTVRRFNCPAITFDIHLGCSGVDHRLNRHRHTGKQSSLGPVGPKIWDLRLLVECFSNSMTDKLPDHTKSGIFNRVLHSPRNRQNFHSIPYLLHCPTQGGEGDVNQSLRFRIAQATNNKSPSPISNHSVEFYANINFDDIPKLKPPSPRKSVNDFTVYRNAGIVWKSLVTQECARPTVTLNVAANPTIHFASRDAWHNPRTNVL